MVLPPASDPDCPFCRIASAYSPIPFPVPSPTSEEEKEDETSSASTSEPPLAHILLSTPTLIAFLDHAPISRGHVLLATRQHRLKLSDASIEEGQAVGAWLGILSRAVVDTVSPPETLTHAGGAEGGIGDWNVVQNNGARAAQVVPHVHFHIIPRSGDVPEVKARSWTVFGKGQREDLDDEDAAVLRKQMRQAIRKELDLLREREGDGALRLLLGRNPTKAGRVNL